MVLNDAEEQRLLRVEVVIDRALGDTGGGRDVVETRVSIPTLGEHVECRLE
jgi:hypothetical protein